MRPGDDQSLEEVIRETLNGLNPFFLLSLIICNGNFHLLPETYWKEMTTRCPSEYLADRSRPLGENSNWGSTRPQNKNVVYKRGYRYSLKKWEDIVKQLRLNPMTDDNIDCSRLIPFLSQFTNNARDCGCQSEDILPLEYIGKAKNIIRRNRNWANCVTKQEGFHGMLEYFIKYIGEVPHHVHVVGCFVNDRQSLNAEAFVATICQGSDSEGYPRIDFSSKDGTAFNVAPCGHYGFFRLNTDALKQWKLGKINLEISIHRNWQRFADKQRAAAKNIKDGNIDLNCPFQNNLRNTKSNPSQAQQDHRTEFTERLRTASKKSKAGIVDSNCPIQNNWRNPSIAQQDQRNEFAKRSRTAGKKLKAGTHDDPFVESKISFTNKVRAAAKKKRDGIVDEHDPFLTNLKTQGDALANSSKSASKTWQEGKIDPMNPQHKSWMNTGSRITEKHTITFMKKFEKQVQDWIPQRHLNWSAISRKTRKWMGHVRECNNGKRNSLTDAQNQLLLKLNFPFYPYLDKRNSEYKRLQEFQRENGPKSIPSSATWQEGVRDPITHPVHKVWMNTDSRISEKHIITYTKKFEKQVQDWWKQKDSDAISPETTAWMRNIRQRNKGNGKYNPLTNAEYQLLLKLNFPFNPKLEFWNSEFKRLLEFQAENGAKSLPCSTKGNKHRNLYQWCTRQRLEARKNKLSAEQLVRLKSVLDW